MQFEVNLDSRSDWEQNKCCLQKHGWSLRHGRWRWGILFVKDECFMCNNNLPFLLGTVEQLEDQILELAIDNFAKLMFRERNDCHFLGGQLLQTQMELKDLGTSSSNNLNGSAHITLRLKKANEVMYCIKRNIAYAHAGTLCWSCFLDTVVFN